MLSQASGPGCREPGAVVNLCGLGLGKYSSRFCWMLDDLPRSSEEPGIAQRQRDANRAVPPQDTILAEFGGFFGSFGVQSHPPLTDFEIEYPGEESARPRDEVIRLRDLRVLYNPDTRLLELHSRRLGKKVWPVHLGFLATMHAPPLFRCLLEFSMPFSTAASSPAAWRSEELDGIPCLHSPRIQVGKVVVAREDWAVPSEAIPFDLEPLPFWIAMERLRHRVGLPQAVFRRSELFGRFMMESGREVVEHARQASNVPVPPKLALDGAAPIAPVLAYRDDARKPMYLDFANFHLVNAFRKSKKMQGDRVFFTEAYPSGNEHVLKGPDGHYASELVLELAGITR